MRAEDLTRKWVGRCLDQMSIRRYIQKNLLPSSNSSCLMASELDHISICCYHIYLWSIGKSPALGSFLTLVVNNDLSGAVHTADDVNRSNLWIYPAFLYNVAPAGWKKMMEEE